MEIHFYPNPILRVKCRPLEEVSPVTQKTLRDMAGIMYQAGGVGLAAPQVGIAEQIIVVDVGDGLISLVNPKIVKKQGKSIIEEGCLSLPDVTVDVKRAKIVSVEGLNERGEKLTIEAEGLKAHVLQHEIDHLRGVLIIDYAGWRKKLSLKRKLKALARKGNKNGSACG